MLLEALFMIGAIWIIGVAVDMESAKNIDNLDLLLGYAIDFWMVVIGAALFVLSFAARAYFLARNPKATLSSPSPSLQ